MNFASLACLFFPPPLLFSSFGMEIMLYISHARGKALKRNANSTQNAWRQASSSGFVCKAELASISLLRPKNRNYKAAYTKYAEETPARTCEKMGHLVQRQSGSFAPSIDPFGPFETPEDPVRVAVEFDFCYSTGPWFLLVIQRSTQAFENQVCLSVILKLDAIDLPFRDWK